MISWWRKCAKLVAFHHQRILLHQLDHHFIHQLAFPLGLEVSERRIIHRDIRVEVELVAARTILADADLYLSSRMLHLLWRYTACKLYPTMPGFKPRA